MRKQRLLVQDVFVLLAMMTAISSSSSSCCLSLAFALHLLPCGATFIIPRPAQQRTTTRKFIMSSKKIVHHSTCFRKEEMGHCIRKYPYPTLMMGGSMKSHLSAQVSSADDDTSSSNNEGTIAEQKNNRNFRYPNDNQRLIGILVLLTVPLSWGTYAPVVKYVYEMNPPTPGFVFSAGYYFIASLTLVTLSSMRSFRNVGCEGAVNQDSLSENLPYGKEENTNNDIQSNNSLSWQVSDKTLGGLELGSYLFLGNCLQVVGLESIPADRAAFLVQLTTIMIPILQATFARDFSLIPRTTWVACILAFAGVIIMGFDRPDLDVQIGEEMVRSMSGARLQGISFSGGDSLIIIAALCYSMHVIRLGKYAKVTNPLELAASKATVEASLSVALVLGLLAIPSWTSDIPLFVDNESRDIQTYFSQLQYAVDEGTFPPDGFLKAIVASLWTGLVTCAYTIYAQSFGQRRVDPTDANLIYTMQPVFSAMFAWTLLGENLGAFGYAGATFIGVALWIVTSNKGSRA